MITNYSNEIKKIQNSINHHQYIGLAIGFIVLGITVYSFNLSIKVNKLNLRKLNNEGYK